MDAPAILLINPETRNSSDIEFIASVTEIDAVVNVEAITYPDEWQYSLRYGFFKDKTNNFKVNLFSTSGSISLKTILPRLLSYHKLPIIGYIFLIDSREVRPDFPDYATEDLGAFYEIVGDNIPHIIAIVRLNEPTSRDIPTIRKDCHIPPHVKVFECNPKARGSVKQILLELMNEIEKTPLSKEVKEAIEML